jgi:hypothetical protein
LECGRFWVVNLHHGHGWFVCGVVYGVGSHCGFMSSPFLSVRGMDC